MCMWSATSSIICSLSSAIKVAVNVLCQARKLVNIVLLLFLLIIVFVVLTQTFPLRIHKVFCPMCKGATEVTDVLHWSTHLQVGVVPLPLVKICWIQHKLTDVDCASILFLILKAPVDIVSTSYPREAMYRL
jgi:hypothetical protein